MKRKSATVKLPPATRTIATRLTPPDMKAVSDAAAEAGQTSSEWLRNAALSRCAEPGLNLSLSMETRLLGEIRALRLLIANVFAQANLGVSIEAIEQILAYCDSVRGREAGLALQPSPAAEPAV